MSWVQYFLVSSINQKRIIFLKENTFLTQTIGNSKSISLRGKKGNTFVLLSRGASGILWGIVLVGEGLECPSNPQTL